MVRNGEKKLHRRENIFRYAGTLSGEVKKSDLNYKL